MAESGKPRTMRGPYVLRMKHGRVTINVDIPFELHDEVMRLIIKNNRNPNRSEFVRQAIREKVALEKTVNHLAGVIEKREKRE